MKILHTADWHLGRIMFGLNRLDEQKVILNELISICDEQSVDVILIAGDIFSGITTPLEADQMFSDFLIKASNNGNRLIIAIAGNTDEGTRFDISRKFAEKNNILLISTTDYELTAGVPKDKAVVVDTVGKGYIKFHKGEDKVVLAYLPHPSRKILAEAKLDTSNNNEKVKKLLGYGGAKFNDSSVNIVLTHFAMKNPRFNMDFYENYKEDVFPAKADYVALGHIHELTAIKDGSKVFYSGSTIMAGPTEGASKSVIILNTKGNKILNKEFIKLKSPKKMASFNIENYQDGLSKLQGRQDEYIQLGFLEGSLTKDEIAKLKKEFPHIYKFEIRPKMRSTEEKEVTMKKPEEAFRAFYLKFKGEAASEKTVKIFNEIFQRRK